MNYILEKSNKQVIWINTDPNELTGVEAWGNFKPNQHEIVFSLHYNPEIGETFVAEIKDGVAQDFIPQKVYNKTSGEERVLQSWEDKINLETETEMEPLKDSVGNLVEYQKYTDSGWIIDQERKKEALLTKNSQIFYSRVSSYRGTISYKSMLWDSGRTYLENIQKTLTIYNKQLIASLPEWRNASNGFYLLEAKELAELSDLIELDLFYAGQSLYAKKWQAEIAINDNPNVTDSELSALWQ
ncbi:MULTISPECIES: hypothetical protein [Leptospira]|uniref:hypothetical protein n=1 Tax=Leptospira TaxID=171 RepID=UPI0007735D1E|nr:MULTISPECIES: hypothetical protein [Leptospira]UML79169.1 DUF4376 domain-containing protein [Leptospira kirschneri]UML80339.1 DUF4376 domain-containing protein [Leptospira kirschneri]UMQ54034.1 DUF4376 domain-containing protein [Leptospira interrogans]